MTGAITQVDPPSRVFDTRKLYEEIIANSLSRRIFALDPSLKIHWDTFKYWDIINDIKTNYSPDGTEFPVNELSVKDTNVSAPIINTSFVYGRHELARINDSILPFGNRERIAMQKFAIDEYMYAFAGESTYNGVPGLDDTTNRSTAATTELDLTSFTTMKTSLNASLSQLNNNLNASSGGAIIKQFDIVALMTSDVEDRLHQMTSTLDDTISGYNLFENILQKRTGKMPQIEVSNMLGATIAKDGNSFKKTVDGTTNFALIVKNPALNGIALSGLNRIETTDRKGFELDIEERWVPYSVNTESIIYSGTVDIVP